MSFPFVYLYYHRARANTTLYSSPIRVVILIEVVVRHIFVRIEIDVLEHANDASGYSLVVPIRFPIWSPQKTAARVQTSMSIYMKKLSASTFVIAAASDIRFEARNKPEVLGCLWAFSGFEPHSMKRIFMGIVFSPGVYASRTEPR